MRRCDSTQTGKTVSVERAHRVTLRHDYTRPGVEPWWENRQDTEHGEDQ